MAAKPRLAVFKFASCDGCQLQVLSLEEALLELGSRVDVAYFPEASSRMEEGPYDVTLVEGSVSAPEHAAQLARIREQSRTLVTIGACATAGGLQALRNLADADALAAAVYPDPGVIETLADSTPIREHVKVDFELHGCPVDRHQLAHVLADLLRGAEPRLPTSSVCQECKRHEQVCVLVAKGEPCLGPVTRDGCGALCPGFGRACYGCFGPADLSFPAGREQPNSKSLGSWFHRELGLAPAAVARRFHLITSHLSPFREAGLNWRRRDAREESD